MTTFRFYITDLYAGEVKGTDSEETARSYAISEDFYVVDSKNGVWLACEGESAPIEEIQQ